MKMNHEGVELKVPETSLWTQCFLTFLEHKAERKVKTHRHLWFTYEQYLWNWHDDFCND